MQRGYIKIWRKLEDSGLLQIPNTIALFMFILLKATYKPIKIGTPIGVFELERGQYISGRIKLAKDLEQTEREIRTSLGRLVDKGVISIKTTSKFSIYTIVNYDLYQSLDDMSDQQTTSKRPANDQQTTTKQELKHLSIKELNTNTTMSPPALPKADPVQYEEIVNLYHQTLPMCPKVVMLTAKRRGQIAARWKSGVLPDLETWKSYFEFVSKSDFLTGKTDPINGHKRFVANLEWLTNETNFVKTWEHKYHGK